MKHPAAHACLLVELKSLLNVRGVWVRLQRHTRGWKSACRLSAALLRSSSQCSRRGSSASHALLLQQQQQQRVRAKQQRVRAKQQWGGAAETAEAAISPAGSATAAEAGQRDLRTACGRSRAAPTGSLFCKRFICKRVGIRAKEARVPQPRAWKRSGAH